MRLGIVRTLAFMTILVPASVSASRLRTTPRAKHSRLIKRLSKQSNPVPGAGAVRTMSRLGLLSDRKGPASMWASSPASWRPIGEGRRADRQDVAVSVEQQWAIVRAIDISGRPEWRTLRAASPTGYAAAPRDDRPLLAGKLPTLEEAPIERIDWGEKVRAQFTLAKYFRKASDEVKLELKPDLLVRLGYTTRPALSPAVPNRVMLRWTKVARVLEKLTLGSMAKYTLANQFGAQHGPAGNLKWAAEPPQPAGVKRS